MQAFPWRSAVALVLILIIFVFNLSWVWALVALLWIVPDLMSGTTFLMEPIERARNPILYWIILLVWLGVGTHAVLEEFAPQLLPSGWSSTPALYTSYEAGILPMESDNESMLGDTLHYFRQTAATFQLIGRSAPFTLENYDSVTTALWDDLAANDFAPQLPLVSDHVYVLQTGMLSLSGAGEVFIGYRTKLGAEAPTGLHAIEVPAADYAVMRITENHSEQLRAAWTQVALSNLEPIDAPTAEVWVFNADGSAVQHVQLMVPIGDPSDRKLTEEKDLPLVLEATHVVAVEQPREALEQEPPQQELDPEPEGPQEAFTLPTRKHEAFHVVGLSATANPNDENALGKALETLWNDFYKADYSRHINNITEPNNVYVTYTNYTENSVQLTLGYRTATPKDFKDNKGLKSASVAANSYFTDAIKTNGTTYDKLVWKRLLSAVTTRQPSSADFEVYTFNSKYEVEEATLWVAAR